MVKNDIGSQTLKERGSVMLLSCTKIVYFCVLFIQDWKVRKGEGRGGGWQWGVIS